MVCTWLCIFGEVGLEATEVDSATSPKAPCECPGSWAMSPFVETWTDMCHSDGFPIYSYSDRIPVNWLDGGRDAWPHADPEPCNVTSCCATGAAPGEVTLCTACVPEDWVCVSHGIGCLVDLYRIQLLVSVVRSCVVAALDSDRLWVGEIPIIGRLTVALSVLDRKVISWLSRLHRNSRLIGGPLGVGARNFDRWFSCVRWGWLVVRQLRMKCLKLRVVASPGSFVVRGWV